MLSIHSSFERRTRIPRIRTAKRAFLEAGAKRWQHSPTKQNRESSHVLVSSFLDKYSVSFDVWWTVVRMPKEGAAATKSPKVPAKVRRPSKGKAPAKTAIKNFGPPLKELDAPKKETIASTEKSFINFGLGDENLIHSVQLSSFLRHARSSDGPSSDLVVPKLVICEPSNFEPVPFLSPETIQELLKRSVILIVTHAGYDETTDSVLQTVVDLAGSFIERLCRVLKINDDTRDFRSERNFENDMYRILEEVGSSVPSLQHFIQNISTQKSNLIKEVTKKYGPVIEPPKLWQTSSQSSSNLTEPLDLIVGLEEDPSDKNDENFEFATWEQSLDVSSYSIFEFVTDHYLFLGTRIRRQRIIHRLRSIWNMIMN